MSINDYIVLGAVFIFWAFMIVARGGFKLPNLPNLPTLPKIRLGKEKKEKKRCKLFVFSEKTGTSQYNEVGEIIEIEGKGEEIFYDGKTFDVGLKFWFNTTPAFIVWQHKNGEYKAIKKIVGLTDEQQKAIYQHLNAYNENTQKAEAIVQQPDEFKLTKIFQWVMVVVVFAIALQVLANPVTELVKVGASFNSIMNKWLSLCKVG